MVMHKGKRPDYFTGDWQAGWWWWWWFSSWMAKYGDGVEPTRKIEPSSDI